MGTELSIVALKNHVEKVIWYGGDAYPVLDQHWIAKQYYHDLLATTPLPATQETFDKYFKVSFNLCNEKTKDNSFVSVEDEFFNLFEVKREFATIAKNQGFVNVISSDYLLRDYMTENNKIFTTDPKAIPYVSADYARTKRNIILKICLQMSILGMLKKDVIKELVLIGMDADESSLKETVWKNICAIYCENGEDEIAVNTPAGMKIFTEDTIAFKREFSVETGKFEDIFIITDIFFKQYVIDDLQSAKYIAEKGNASTFLGTELKGHILQKYLPGQFITLSGKYYEMVSISSDNQVIVRRAADHINARHAYRQVRRINIDSACDNEGMGMLKSINGVKVYNQFANFSVDTPAYWRMYAYSDFENAKKVVINNVPARKYINKCILKLDFSGFGKAFTDEIRTTLTLLMNEVFRTMFAENQPFIIAATKGDYEKPLTYSLSGEAVEENCIYIIEDSQLDIGLLVAVERNFERIMQIISDYLAWNKSVFYPEQLPVLGEEPKTKDAKEPEPAIKKSPVKEVFGKTRSFFGNILGGLKKKKEIPEVPAQDYMMIYGKPHKKVNGKWVACSQEEFDRKMENRHQAIEEKKEAEKEAKAIAEAETNETSVPVDEALAIDVQNEKSPDVLNEETSDAIEEPLEEKPKRKGFFRDLFKKRGKKDNKSLKNDDSETDVPLTETAEGDSEPMEQSYDGKEEELDVSGV